MNWTKVSPGAKMIHSFSQMSVVHTYNIKAIRGDRAIEYQVQTDRSWVGFVALFKERFGITATEHETSINLGYKFVGRDPVRAPYTDLSTAEDYTVVIQKVMQYKKTSKSKETTLELCDRVSTYNPPMLSESCSLSFSVEDCCKATDEGKEAFSK